MDLQENIVKASLQQRLRVAELTGDDDFIQKAFSVMIEKGKPAVVGEERMWSGVKYRKVASGKWEEVRGGNREGESTVSIGVGTKKTATQLAAERSQQSDATDRKREYKKNEAKNEKRYNELSDEYDEAYDDLEDYVRQRKDMLVDMEEEVGSAPEEDKDRVGNEYGERLNEIDEKISELKGRIEKINIEFKKL